MRAFASASRVEEGSDDLTEFIDLFEVKGGSFQLEFVVLWGRGGRRRGRKVHDQDEFRLRMRLHWCRFGLGWT